MSSIYLILSPAGNKAKIFATVVEPELFLRVWRFLRN